MRNSFLFLRLVYVSHGFRVSACPPGDLEMISRLQSCVPVTYTTGVHQLRTISTTFHSHYVTKRDGRIVLLVKPSTRKAL